jgi:hypothetical protein
MDPETRKLIRSHVMLGKNRGKTQHPRRGEPTVSGFVGDSNQALNGPQGSLIKISHSIIPRKVGSDLSFIQFADTMELSLVADILKCRLISTIWLRLCYA